MGDLTENFSREEFQCQCGCGLGEISMDLVRRLQEVRDALGEPMKITSGIRCGFHNANVKGAAGSSHVPDSNGIACAVDIGCDNSVYRQKLLKAIMPIMDRVGIAKTFIHCDVDANKTVGVVWLY